MSDQIKIELVKVKDELVEIKKFLKENSQLTQYEVSYDFVQISKDTDDYEPNCNSVSFKNTGTTTVVINESFPILPTDGMLTLGNEISHHDKSTYRIRFDGPGPKSLQVIKRFLIGKRTGTYKSY